MTRKKIVALLPLKENSERIAGKNFKDFAGKPLFFWMLDSLLKNNNINSVVINTDAGETLLNHGLKQSKRVIIKERPVHLRGDDISMNLIIEDDVNFTEADLYLMTHTTNPLLSTKTITEAIEVFLAQSDHDSLFTVNKVQSRFYDEKAVPINHDPDNLIQTQDLPLWYEENSCLYIFTKKSFLKTKTRIGSNPMVYPISKTESVDIDIMDDWNIAEAIMILKNS